MDRQYLAPLVSNPGVISITVMPATTRVKGKDFRERPKTYPAPERVK